MLCLDNILIEIEASSYEEVLNKLSRHLVKNGYVKDSFFSAILSRENTYPTGLPSEPFGVAIPHTDPEHVINPCIIVMKLKNSVPFRNMGQPENWINASYIFGLVFTDGKKQVPLLQSIITLVSNPIIMEKLKIADSKEDVLSILNKFV